jgi:hypothetical protein
MNDSPKRKDINKKMEQFFFIYERLHDMVWPIFECQLR